MPPVKTVPSALVLIIFSSFIVAITIFLYGFFPLKHNDEERSGFSDIPSRLDLIRLNKTRYQNRISHTILMVVDAFRYDFLSADNMEYIISQIQKEDSCLYKIKVDSPTVTMPRIKSLTTGTISSFIDVVLNLGDPELVSDSIIHQMYDRGDRIVFYGDNTWTKLFPGMFHRKQENMDSFFVNDFYEGDKNITKRLAAEFKYSDWNFLILHYLGLDHIGHVESSFSPKIPDKLREMDRVAQQIHHSMDMLKRQSKLPPLFILTADHGMRNSGGHGGSSNEEIFVPLVLFGLECSQRKVQQYNQIDISPTLAVLHGCPIPATSIGKIIYEAIEFLDYEDQLYILYYNAKHLMDKITQRLEIDSVKDENYFQQYQRAKMYHGLYLKSLETTEAGDRSFFTQAKNDYEHSSKIVSELLAESFVHFDMFAIGLGLLLATCSTFITILMAHFNSSLKPRGLYTIWRLVAITVFSLVIMVLFCKCSDTESSLCQIKFSSFMIFLTLSIITYISYEVLQTMSYQVQLDFENFPYFLVFGIIFHAFSLFSSSFIEEEHQTWYYFTTTFFLLMFCSEIRQIKFNAATFQKLGHIYMRKFLTFDEEVGTRSNRSDADSPYLVDMLQKMQSISQLFFGWSKVFVLHFFIRRLNQTGDKWLSIPDIGDWFVAEENKLHLSFFLFLSLLLLVYATADYCGLLTCVLSFTAILLIYYYRTTSGSVLLFDIKESSSKTCLIIFWLNIIEILSINYIPVLYRLIFFNELPSGAIKYCLGANITLLALILALLNKPHNVILIPACILTIRHVFSSVDKVHKEPFKIVSKIIISHWIGKMFFFYAGNSNNLASIDLNAGYIGLETYNPFLVPFFVGLNTYSGPILCYLMLLYDLVDTDTLENRKRVTFVIAFTPLLVMLPMEVYLFVMTKARSHIFVWTVFSPKILYEFCNSCLYYVLVFMTYCAMKFVRVL